RGILRAKFILAQAMVGLAVLMPPLLRRWPLGNSRCIGEDEKALGMAQFHREPSLENREATVRPTGSGAAHADLQDPEATAHRIGHTLLTLEPAEVWSWVVDQLALLTHAPV